MSFSIQVARVVKNRCLHPVLMLLSLLSVTASAGEPLKFVGFDEMSHSPAAHKGLLEILSGRLFHAGMPLSAIKALAETNGPVPKATDDLTSPHGQYYATSKIPSPPSREAKLPLGESMFVRNDVMLVNSNCFSCHAGVVRGQVVAGLPNNRVIPSNKALSPSPERMKQLLSGSTPAEQKELHEFLAATGNRLNLPESSSRGDHFGPYIVWNAGAHLSDPERSGLLRSRTRSDLVKLIESTPVPNVDPMPWWLMKYKKKDYWYADGGIFDAAHFALNFTTPHEHVNANRVAHVESTRKALTFARETHSPVFPKSLNVALVKRGADLFHGRIRPQDPRGFVSCKTCHGTYTKKTAKSDFAKPGSWRVDYHGSERLRNVRTDTAYNATLQKFRPIAEHINKLGAYYKAQGTPELTPHFSVPRANGYVPPPLVGIWASAPYFHNGSVPTIEAVLNSKLRPEIWLRNIDDPHAYDLSHVGLEYRPLTRSEFEKSRQRAATSLPLTKAAVDHQAIYDTKSFGHGNMGHTFGDRLNDGERTAVIEFLKSLSGPDM